MLIYLKEIIYINIAIAANTHWKNWYAIRLSEFLPAKDFYEPFYGIRGFKGFAFSNICYAN